MTGRFVQTDLIPGGSANDYCSQDPVNCYDLDGTFWGSGVLKKVAHAVKKSVQVVTHHTVGFCVTSSAGAGPFGMAGGCIALSGGHLIFMGLLGGGGSSPTASLTGGLLISNAHNRNQLNGPFGFAGGSADLGASVGDNFSFGNDSQNQSIWENEISAGLGPDLPIPSTAVPAIRGQEGSNFASCVTPGATSG